jgi:hypothetical protein
MTLFVPKGRMMHPTPRSLFEPVPRKMIRQHPEGDYVGGNPDLYNSTDA